MPDEWSSRSRMATAMSMGEADRVPVMCQLSLGHYFLNAGLDPVDIWHDSEAFGEALIRLQGRYGFDGILVNLPGRDPDWRRGVSRIERIGNESRIRWSNGWTTVQPADDNPHVYRENAEAYHPSFEEIDPDRLFYVEPHDSVGVTYPTAFGPSGERAAPGPGFFPPYAYDTVRFVVEHAGDVSVHAEVFSPFSQLMELVDYERGLLALLQDPGKAKACLERLTDGAIVLARGLLDAGADALLISSAFVGAPFLSRRHYEEFVLPYERRLVAGIKETHAAPVYTHTCGAIGDRLDLMMATGLDGIDTLDPPPLGTVDLATARAETYGRIFLKGNLDPVSELLLGDPEAVRRAARSRIEIAGPGGGYILSTACSVPPRTEPAKILELAEIAENVGRYPMAGMPPIPRVARWTGEDRSDAQTRRDIRLRHRGRPT